MRNTSGRIAAALACLVYAGVWLALPGCKLSESDDGTGTLHVRSEGTNLIVTNDLDDRIYYLVVGRETAAVIDWIPHLDDSASVPAGQTRFIAHDTIMKGPHETQVIFYWWRAVTRNGERTPGEIQSVIVDL